MASCPIHGDPAILAHVGLEVYIDASLKCTCNYTPCEICGQLERQHNGPQRFCPVYATYRPQREAESSVKKSEEDTWGYDG